MSNPLQFNQYLFDNVLSKLPPNGNNFIVGDINLNLFNPLKLNYVDEFIAGLLGFGFFPAITKATKFNELNTITRYSLIDQIWCNFQTGSLHKSFIIDHEITDHFPILYIFKVRIKHLIKHVKYRLINSVNTNSFVSAVQNMYFDDILDADEPDSAFSIFYNKLFNLYKANFPVKKRKSKKTSLKSPWMTYKLKQCIRKKFRLYNLLKRGHILRRDFNSYKNTLTYVMNQMRRQYYHELFYRNKNNIKQTWSTINDLTRRSHREVLTEVLDNNDCLVRAKDMSNHFNNFFTTVVQNLIVNVQTNLNIEYFNDFINMTSSCFLFPATVNEVASILNALPNKGNSMYDIKVNLLKKVQDVLNPILVHLYNFCITRGCYPTCLKVARVVPIHKKGPKNIANNYRPISNLATINKIFEKLTFDRLSNFMERFNILSKFQFGFRKGSSTTLAIFRFTQDILKTFNYKLYTVALFLDLKKAFDTVSIEILSLKLFKYGFRGNVHAFIMSYLTGRGQFVDCDGFTSNLQDVISGVPQGSVLGPLLFNLFINDIVDVNPSQTILFADDAVMYVTDSCFKNCIEKIRRVIDNLSKWLVNNRLVPNVNKTKLMMFSPRPVNNIPDIYFNQECLEWVNTIKYLGVTIDNKLSFIPHVADVKMKLSKLQGVTYSLSYLVPRSSLLTIFYSLVYPVLIDNVIIWGGISKTNIKSIEVKLNNILRNILNIGRDENNIPMESTNNMYKALRMLKFNDIYHFHVLKFLHYALYSDNDIFNTFYASLIPNNRYNTRNNRINLPPVRLDIEKQAAVFRSCMLMNELPLELI